MDSPRGQSADKTASSWLREVTPSFSHVCEQLHREGSLAGMHSPDAFNEYVKRATGEKFLVTPHAHC
jgi:hypothetical protein